MRVGKLVIAGANVQIPFANNYVCQAEVTMPFTMASVESVVASVADTMNNSSGFLNINAKALKVSTTRVLVTVHNSHGTFSSSNRVFVNLMFIGLSA